VETIGVSKGLALESRSPENDSEAVCLAPIVSLAAVHCDVVE
jgi:hypothetical protein